MRDDKGRPFIIDPRSGGLVTVDEANHSLHEGNHYIVSDFATVADGAIREFLLVTPNTSIIVDLDFYITGTLDTTVRLYEGSAKTPQVSGLQTAFNSNRRSTNSATMLVYLNPLGDDALNGTLLYTDKFGSDTALGSPRREGRSEQEFLLKRNANYLLKVSSGTNANVITTILSWYESVARFS